jgi:hypothetical protein
VLSEGRDAAGVIALLLSLAQDGPVACCTHGDVLFDVVRAIAGSGIPLDGPFDVPVACTWVLQVEGDRFTGGSFVGRPNR